MIHSVVTGLMFFILGMYLGGGLGMVQATYDEKIRSTYNLKGQILFVTVAFITWPYIVWKTWDVR